MYIIAFTASHGWNLYRFLLCTLLPSWR
jgi:hypothetical protein